MNIEFIIVFVWLILSFGISGLLSVASFFLGEKNPDKEKVSVYECGFDPFHNPGEPFSIRFFLIAILFLVFDLEITYLFPWSVNSNHISLVGQVYVYLFLGILVFGLIYEWIKGGLDWE